MFIQISSFFRKTIEKVVKIYSCSVKWTLWKGIKAIYPSADIDTLIENGRTQTRFTYSECKRTHYRHFSEITVRTNLYVYDFFPTSLATMVYKRFKWFETAFSGHTFALALQDGMNIQLFQTNIQVASFS